MKINRIISKWLWHICWTVGAIALTSRLMGVIMPIKELVAISALVSSISFLIATKLEGKTYGTPKGFQTGNSADGDRGGDYNRSSSRSDLLQLQRGGMYHPDLQPSDTDSRYWRWTNTGSDVGHNPSGGAGLARKNKRKARLPRNLPPGSSLNPAA